MLRASEPEGRITLAFGAACVKGSGGAIHCMHELRLAFAQVEGCLRLDEATPYRW